MAYINSIKKMTNSTEEFSKKKDYFSLCRLMLKISGVHLYEKRRKIDVLYTYFINIIFIITSVCVMVEIVCTKRHGILDWIYFYGSVLSTMKSIVLVFKKDLLKDVLEKLESGLFVPDVKRGGEEEVKFISTRTNFLRVVSKCCTIAIIVVPYISLISWYNAKSRKWPFGIFWEIINYEVSVVLQVVVFAIYTNIYLTVDMIFLLVLSHIQLHLINLQRYFENITNCRDEFDANGDTLRSWNILKTRLAIGVDYHNAIFEISEKTESVYKYIHLLIFVTAASVFCGLIYDISFRRSSDTMLFLEIFYVFGLLIVVCLHCYFGNAVTNKSTEIAESCMRAGFVGADVRFQKGLLFVMHRSQKPIVFTIGKFAPLTLGTAIYVMRATYSYFTVLRNMDKEIPLDS